MSHIITQVASLVTNSEKNPTKWDPRGMIGTYSGYLKTMVTNPSGQGLARDQADKFVYYRGIWDPPETNISAKVMEQNVFNGHHAW